MSSHPWGGSEELWHGAATVLAQAGHNVAVSVKSWPSIHSKIQSLAANGVRINFRRGMRRRNLRELTQRLLKGKESRSDQSETHDLISKLRPDLICVSNGNYKDGIAFLEAASQSGIPFVSVVQANAECFWPTDEEAARIANVYQQAHRVFFVSEANRRLLERQLAIDIPRATVVHNPVNVDRDVDIAWPSVAPNWRLACVARLEPNAKGQDLLLETLAKPKWKARNLEVSLIGSGASAECVHRLVTHFGVQDKVTLTGHVDNISDVWASHHALVLPSRYEGLPLALVEAMLSARTAIVTDVAGNCEIVQDAISGFVAEFPSVQSLDEAMENAWIRRDDWREIGLTARTHARNLWPVDPCGQFSKCLLSLI